MAAKNPINYDAELAALRAVGAYKDAILDLRRRFALHPFVEERMRELLGKADARLFADPEKHGISNGRVDLAAYVASRAVLHFELIATAKNEHVFRDTHSLLVSRADTKLAIVIDQDVDPTVAKAFVAAVPNGEIEFIWLRDVLLMSEEERVIQLLRQQVARAEYVAGGLDPSSFNIGLDRYTLRPLRPFTLAYRNATPGARFEVELRTPDELVQVGDFTPTTTSGTVRFVAPLSMWLRPGEHRLQVRGDAARSATWVQIVDVPRVPRLVIQERAPVRPGDTVHCSLVDFPPGAYAHVMFWTSGFGFGEWEGSVDTQGAATFEFRMPAVFGSAVVRSGAHILSARIPGFEARAIFTVDASAGHELIDVGGSHSVSGPNASITVEGVRLVRGGIRIARIAVLNTGSLPMVVPSMAAWTVMAFDEGHVGAFCGPLGDEDSIAPGSVRELRDLELHLMDAPSAAAATTAAPPRTIRLALPVEIQGHHVTLDVLVGIPAGAGRLLLGLDPP